MESELIVKDYDIEIEVGGNYHDISFMRNSRITTDNNYGSDLDGNRGTAITFTEDDYADRVYVDNLTLEDYDSGFQKEVRDAIQKWLNENEVETENI